MHTDHLFAIKFLNRQIKNFTIELARIIPFRDNACIKEMEQKMTELTKTVTYLEKPITEHFVNDAVVINYLDAIFIKKLTELEEITRSEDDRVQKITDICIKHGAYGRAIKFANPDYFTQTRTMLIEKL